MRCLGKDELQKKKKMTVTLVNYYFFSVAWRTFYMGIPLFTYS